MKRKPQIRPGDFDPEKFIRAAKAGAAEETPPPTQQRSRSRRTQRPKRQKAERRRSRPSGRDGGGKGAADGFVRTSFDLREDLYERLKVDAARARRPMREIVEEAVESYLDGGL